MFTRTALHAHNCYPDHGRYPNRFARALASGASLLAIEQDLVWSPIATGGGRVVVSHGEPLNGLEPTLDAHFFHRVARRLDAALAAGHREEWPLLVLHFDFKTNQPEHHRAVWDLLGKYERWLTTAVRGEDPAAVMPIAIGPLLVLTENGEGQHESFHDRVAVGARLRLFGTAPPAPPSADFAALPRAEQITRLASLPTESLMPAPATNYRRWSNHPWGIIEAGGPPNAGEWTAGEDARLRAVVARARVMNLWLRVYALNGHTPAENEGWSPGYNVGSSAAVQRRWDAAIAAGVHFVATDQYERFAERLRRAR